MTDLPRVVRDLATERVRTRQTSADPTSAAQIAAVAAAEAIAAEAAAEVAAEAAAVAESVVNAASAAAAKAAVRASKRAAEAVSAAADAAAQTAMQNALDADGDVDLATATAIASVAVSLALGGAYDVENSINAASATWDGDTADAIVMSTAASAMAAAKVAVAIAAAAAAAATAAIDAATLIEGQLGRNVATAATAVGRAISEHAAQVARTALYGTDGQWDVPGTDLARHAPGHQVDHLRTEWAVSLADPVMPRFESDLESLETVVSLARPAEQGLWRDISLARRMEASLRESEAHFEAAFESAPTAMLVASLVNGRPAEFLRVNPALSALTGYPPDRLLVFGFVDLAHPDQQALADDVANNQRADDEEPYERVRRWVHADGHDILVRLRMAAVRTSSGRPDQLVCQIEDVTARRRADAVLRTSEARFRRAFEGAPQAAVLIELAGKRLGRLFAANRAAATMFGRSEVEMSWLDLDSLTHPVERPVMRALLDQLRAGELTHYDGEHRYQTAEGNIAWLEMTAQVVPAADGSPEHLLAYLRDDTDHAAARRAVEPPVLVEPSALTAPATTDLVSQQPIALRPHALVERAQLLGVDTVEQAACLLVRVINDLGGTCVPARLATEDAIGIDISLGEGETLLPVAPVGSPIRTILERDLPHLIEDLRSAIRLGSRLQSGV